MSKDRARRSDADFVLLKVDGGFDWIVIKLHGRLFHDAGILRQRNAGADFAAQRLSPLHHAARKIAKTFSQSTPCSHIRRSEIVTTESSFRQVNFRTLANNLSHLGLFGPTPPNHAERHSTHFPDVFCLKRRVNPGVSLFRRGLQCHGL